MILLLVEMMNQSLGTCPKFGVHFTKGKLLSRVLMQFQTPFFGEF